MKKILFLLSFLFTFNCHAQWKNWDDIDKKLFITHQTLIVADWSTTRYAARNNFPYGTFETNLVLGRYPSVDKVDLYFVAVLLGNYFLANWLPSDARKLYLTGGIMLQANVVNNNIQLGWKLSF